MIASLSAVVVCAVASVLLFAHGHRDARVVESIAARPGLENGVTVDYVSTHISGPWIAASVVLAAVAVSLALDAVRRMRRADRSV